MRSKIWLISIVIWVTSWGAEICKKDNLLPRLHQNKVSIEAMYADLTNHPQIRHHYVVNYPISLLNSPKINSLVSIYSMQWQENQHPHSLSYRIEKFHSDTVMLIALTSHHLLWQHFTLCILHNDYDYRPDLYFGDLTIDNAARMQRQIVHSVVLPPTMIAGFAKSVVFVTGIQARALAPNNYSYDLSVTSLIYYPNYLTITIIRGPTTLLDKLYLSFVVFYPSPSNIKKVDTFDFFQLGQPVYAGLRSDLPITDFYIFGIKAMKFTLDQMNFGLSIDIVSQYVMQVTANNKFEKLGINYFGISPNPEEICSECGKNQFIYSEGWNNQCIEECSEDTWIKSYKNGGKACVKCPNLLNMTLPRHRQGCDCAPGFFVRDNRCISFMELSGGVEILNNAECQDPNQQKNDYGQCICKAGYVKNGENICIRKCGNGYQKQEGGCYFCEPGTFVWEDLKQCNQCAENCYLCENFWSCKECKIGYYRDNDGLCSEHCGDGILMSMECDDGNNVGGDGCSSVCTVEDGFSCTLDSPSVCQRRKYQIISISQQYSHQTLVIDLVLQPTPEIKYTQTQLKKMISIAIEKDHNQPTKTYLSQDEGSKQKFRIVLSYMGTPPRENFMIQVRFINPTDGSVLSFNVQTEVFGGYSVFNSRFNDRMLT